MHGGGFLAGDIARRHHPKADGEPAQRMVGSVLHLAQCGVDRLGRRRIGDVDVGVLGADHKGGQPGTVEHQMRPVAQQPAVLDRGRLALLAVGDQHGVAPRDRGRAYGPQLHREREGGTASAPNAGRPNLVEQGRGIVERRIAAAGAVLRVILDSGAGGEQSRGGAGPDADGETGGHCVGRVHG